MNRFYCAKFFLILFLLSGCAWLQPSRGISQEDTVTGQIVDVERLRKGGKLLVVPFQAGANVAANEQLDKVVLMMVKGIVNELQGSDIPIQILDTDDAKQADLVISGHVTGFVKPSKWKKVPLRPGINKVNIEGRLTDAATGITILVFKHSRQGSTRQMDHAQLGYDLGKDIGRYIKESSR